MATRRKTRRRKTPKEALSIALIAIVLALSALSFVISFQRQYGRWPGWDELFHQAGLSNVAAVTGVPKEVQENGTVFHFIDVGQADATLIAQAGRYCLVDAGDQGSADALLGYLDALGVKTLDYLVMTHPHADHIGSMDDVLENYEVKQVILPDFSLAQTPTSNIFQKVLGVIAEKEIPAVTAAVGDSYPLGEGNITILGAGVPTDNYNDLSLVLRFDAPSLSLLCSGDGEAAVENAALAGGANLKADVFQAGHHGSSTSNSPDFLRAVSPSLMVISCGKDNSYGHPHQETLDSAANQGISVCRTDLQGHIAVYRGAEGLAVCPQKEAD